ncbi:SCO family protein [Natrinema sp. 1APR25-10V2]|uniref:SCO family protein n=1 Tax=Natrinema sp. 1APR25-10V2 TaxID=2951081 RepID=UPI002875B988|nr:SCO family protein [Natrinema sp. 1APR25-10V2]MDS0475150.1 SCO family protein [Natrinema sp. 1APR25-10V2]
MDRRTYLGSLGVAGLSSAAGCLGDALGGGDSAAAPDTVLGPPEYEQGDPSYPAYGEEFPSFSIHDPLKDETITLEHFVDERPFVMTHIYTTCPDGACPALLQHLNRIQKDAAEKGYKDDVGLVAMTFDPNRDTADALRSFATQIGIDYEAETWHFLRPENNEEAKSIMTDTFGLPLQRREEMPNANSSTTNSSSDNESMTHDHGEYMFTHFSQVSLVNDRGIVERAYPRAATQTDQVNTQVMVEDTRTVAGVDS